MKKFSILLFVLISMQINSQTKPNSVYFELFGNGGLYSINYDRLLTENISARIGISYIRKLDLIFFAFNNLVIVPATVNYLYGSKQNKIELGAGIVYLSVTGGEAFGFDTEGEDYTETGVAGTAVIGYRYQQQEGGFMFRIGFTPLFSPDGFQPFAGLSLGYSF